MDDSLETSPQPLQELTPEERLEFFKTVHALVASNPGNITKIGVDSQGRMDSMQTKELIENALTLDLKDAQPGDVVWWSTLNSDNYFKVGTVSENEGISGSFQSFKKDGQQGRTYDTARLRGSSMRGTMFSPRKIKQNIPVEMGLPPSPESPEPRVYWSSPVKQMGIIKAEEMSAKNLASD